MTLGHLVKHPSRIELIAYDIWTHYKAYAKPDGFKAQVVAYDREAVILYKRALNKVIAADLVEEEGLSPEEAESEADIRRYSEKHNLSPKGFRVKAQKHMWGSCGKDDVINLNWHLVFAPRPILEYAVVHELCHLKYRTHSPSFWRFLGTIYPDYEKAKFWLEKNEHLLGYAINSPVEYEDL